MGIIQCTYFGLARMLLRRTPLKSKLVGPELFSLSLCSWSSAGSVSKFAAIVGSFHAPYLAYLPQSTVVVVVDHPLFPSCLSCLLEAWQSWVDLLLLGRRPPLRNSPVPFTSLLPSSLDQINSGPLPTPLPSLSTMEGSLIPVRGTLW